MIIDEQIAVSSFFECISKRDFSEALEIIETHISRIFLVGNRAFKLKRAVTLPYVDFSTPELRLEACLKEVAFNAPTAPGLYLGVREIRRCIDGSLSLDGEGELVDAVVEMVRFEQDALLDKIAGAGHLSRNLMIDTVQRIAEFHAQTPIVQNEGGAANIAGVLDINEGGFATSNLFSPEELQPFHRRFREQLARHADRLETRAGGGKIRRGHGDLHLRNIVVWSGVPNLFDCIEFNDKIATVDVLYDLAFLLMDLWHRGYPDLASLAANRYLDLTDNEDGFVLLPFFMALRASVRAHVTATLIEEGGKNPEALAVEARSYFDLALAILEERPPKLIAIGGFSGSGKSTVAEALAATVGSPPGARLIESDRIRKALHGVSVETRLKEQAYQPVVSERVYGEMARMSREILADGGSVIADAVFNDEDRRIEIAKSASDAGTPFAGFWLDVDAGELHERVAARRKGASDATLDVLARQLAKGEGNLDWHRLSGRASPKAIADKILKMTRPSGQEPVDAI